MAYSRRTWFWISFLQGRAWSLRFDDTNSLLECLRSLLTCRLTVLKTSYVKFPLNKGSSNQPKIERSSDVNAELDVVNEKSSGVFVKIDPEQNSWHEYLLGLTEGSTILIYGETKTFQNVGTNCFHQSEFEVLSMFTFNHHITITFNPSD